MLISTDTAAARSECLKWPNDPDLFARLRVWALGKPELVSDEQFDDAFDALSTEVFWDEFHARDLLMSISTRWDKLGDSTRSKIEQKILDGPTKYDTEPNNEFEGRRAWEILKRLHWLQQQGLTLQCDLDTITKELKEQEPNWNPQFANNAAQSREVVVGRVRIDEDYSALLQEPLKRVLSRAKELSEVRNAAFVKNDPFAGLSQNRPVRAFAALRLAAKNGDFPAWAWSIFLGAEQRKSDKAKFAVFVAEQMTLPPKSMPLKS